MAEQLAIDYSQYFKTDIKDEVHKVEETIDDMLTRLDEFENLKHMVHADGALCVDTGLPQVLASKDKLNSVCERLDKLEQLVNILMRNVGSMEVEVTEAESTLGNNSGKLKNIFKPLFFMRTPSEPTVKKASSAGHAPYESPQIFKTEDFFPST